jgi:hypothetical protein
LHVANRISSTFEFPLARASELLVVPKSMPIAGTEFCLDFTLYYSADVAVALVSGIMNRGIEDLPLFSPLFLRLRESMRRDGRQIGHSRHAGSQLNFARSRQSHESPGKFSS